ncbi:hypothetical protein NDA13_002931 [Ustilago tritici]|nr:hypothetical protein NDA13_002931 [Ustilago tritici]
MAHPHRNVESNEIGKYLYSGSNRFYIKGIAYQEPAPIAASTAANEENGGFPEPDSFTDPLALPDACTRDVANLRDLGINTVRVYSVNSSLNHDSCMSTFSNAGIYVILDLALPLNGSINRAQPSWDTGLLHLYAKTIDVFTRYDNLLAVNVANEVVTQPSNANAAPFIKAAVRDVKAYLRSKASSVLVSYSTTDGPNGREQWRDMLAYYLTCASAATSVDLYGLNSYSWCANSSFSASGYSTLTQDFSSLPVPAYLSEFGCVEGVGTGERPWTEVSALFRRPMTDTFSGGVAFSYFPQPSGVDYGLVNVNADQLTTRADWSALRSELANTTSALTGALAGVNAEPAYATCRGGISQFPASTTLPPTPNTQLCNCLEQNAYSCILNAASFNSPNIIGTLTGQACSYLGQRGGSCAPILADGATGTYGNYSFCSSGQRMEWVMSEYYEATQFDAQSCHFAGNATSKTPPAAIDAAFGSCLAQYPVGVTVPRLDGTSGEGAASGTSMTRAPSATGSAGASGGSNAAAGSG